VSLLLAGATALFLTSCTTLENRRDLYTREPVNGPYTRMLHNRSWKTTSTTTTTVTTTQTRSDFKNVVR